jgi:hypothetical protein
MVRLEKELEKEGSVEIHRITKTENTFSKYLVFM